MDRRSQLKLLFLVMVVCFVLGLLSVVLRGLEQDGGPSVTPSPPAGVGQTTILVLGVDRFDQPPMLRAVWFATFRPPGRSVFLYGLPINSVLAGQPATLGSLFSWSPEQGISPTFLSTLSGIVPLQPAATVVMDETAFAALIDYVRGVELNGTLFSGNEVLGFLSLVVDQPDASLASQARLIEAMVRQLPNLGSSPDITPLQWLVPDHAHLSIPVSQLAGALSPLLPVDAAEIHVNRWTGAGQP